MDNSKAQRLSSQKFLFIYMVLHATITIPLITFLVFNMQFATDPKCCAKLDTFEERLNFLEQRINSSPTGFHVVTRKRQDVKVRRSAPEQSMGITETILERLCRTSLKVRRMFLLLRIFLNLFLSRFGLLRACLVGFSYSLSRCYCLQSRIKIFCDYRL